MEQAATVFGGKKLSLEGGGSINGAFLKHRLLDEFSTLIHPAVDGLAGVPNIVDCHGGDAECPGTTQSLSLIDDKTLQGAWSGCATRLSTGLSRKPDDAAALEMTQ